MTRTKGIFSIVVATLILTFSVSAQASVVDDNWVYTVTASITDYTAKSPSYSSNSSKSGNVSGSGTGVFRYSDNELRWGTAKELTVNRNWQSSGFLSGSWKYDNDSVKVTKWGDYSGLRVEGSSGEFKMDGNESITIDDVATFYHRNMPISSSIDKPTFIEVTLDFMIMNYIDETISSETSIVLNMGFWETPNGEKDNGYAGFPDDIFFFLNPFENFGEIQLGGSDYYLSLFSSFEKLDGIFYDAAADKLGITDGTEIWGWVTGENNLGTEQNSFGLSFTISQELPPPPTNLNPGGGTATTPEPATMLLLGAAGLFGLPFARRFRKNA